MISLPNLRALCEAATQAWEQIDAACSGLLARQCKRHAPYMGCATDCGDIANALDPELLNARPVLVEALAALPQLLAECEALRRERQAMRESLMHACELQRASRDNARELWAICQTANYLGEPFSHERVQAKYDEYAETEVLAVERIEALRSLLREACDGWSSLWASDNNDPEPEDIERIRKEGGL